MNAANRAALAFVRAYQKAVSPWLPGRCRFYPSCSEYTIQCFQSFPFFRALRLAVWRILRCNPLSEGYFDPVPDSSPGGKLDG